MSEDKFHEALECYDEALKINPNDVDGWNGKGDAENKLDRYEQAIICYDEALKIKPDEYTWGMKGLLLNKIKKYEEANFCFDKALTINPQNTEVHEWKKNNQWFMSDYITSKVGDAIKLVKIKKFEEAIPYFKEVIKLGKCFPDSKDVTESANSLLGICLAQTGKYEEAITCYDKAISINPNESDHWSKKCMSLSRLGKHEEAIISINKALIINPYNQKYWNTKGCTLFEQSKYEQAIICYEKALNKDPDNSMYWSNKGESLDKLSKYPESISCYEKALKKDPSNDKIQKALDAVNAKSDGLILPLSVSTELSSYTNGDVIVISGSIKNLAQYAQPVTVMVVSPDGNIVNISQVTPNPSGDYSTSFKAGGIMHLYVYGKYEVRAQYGAQKITTTFIFTVNDSVAITEPTPEPEKNVDEKTISDNSVHFSSIDEYENYKKSIRNKLVDEELDEEISEEIHNIVTICIGCDGQLTKEQKFCPNCGTEVLMIKRYLSEDDKRLVDYKTNVLLIEALHTVDKLNNSTDEELFHMHILSVWEDTEKKMIDVVSSNIKSIGYDLKTENLFVKFNNNSLYLYIDVPKKIYVDFLDASSKGKYHHEFIKSYEYFNITEII